ncbi:MAG: RNA 2',3'-cyclic phosphodiesterase [Limnobacter sp.]|nr:RNA 2',3'-cyclic phosphodiesterase [Limnobacter sp.]
MSTEASRAPPMSRFFVALRPDPDTAAELGELAAGLARRCRGKALAACDLHLTLAFIGERPRPAAAGLLALLDGLPRELPALRLETIGRFGPALLWIGPNGTPDWLAEVDQGLRQRLDVAGETWDRRALRPHVTLVRNARDRAAAHAAIGAVPTIEVAGWRLLLGGTHEAATPACRYRWWAPMAAATGEPQ